MSKILLFLFITLISVNTNATETAMEFIQKLIVFGENYDEKIVNYYTDDAKIKLNRKYPNGLERNLELSGVQWKQLILTAMPLAKAQNDKSTYSKIKISKKDNGFKIKANRYSERKCYTDTGYYMIIQPDKKGKLVIIEEYMETQPQTSC